jgi:hypothetical protein
MVGLRGPAGWRLTAVITIFVPIFAVVIYQAVSNNRYGLVVLSMLVSDCKQRDVACHVILILFAGIPTNWDSSFVNDQVAFEICI